MPDKPREMYALQGSSGPRTRGGSVNPSSSTTGSTCPEGACGIWLLSVAQARGDLIRLRAPGTMTSAQAVAAAETRVRRGSHCRARV